MNLEDITAPTVAASTVQSAGAVIGALAVVGFVIYVVFNIIAGRRQVGSELKLAPNRKPYLDDEALETTKLNWTLGAGLALLLIIAVGLPLYWLAEPGRQSGAEDMFDETFISRGQELFDEGSDCAACHGPGGTGGQASYTLLADDGETYIATVQWKAPALNSASLRFTEEELYEIIEYGRPGTPMVGWGEGGQGPLTTQQIDNLVAYVFSLQGDLVEEPEEPDAATEAPYEAVQSDITEQLAEDLGVSPGGIDYTDPATGEALFNMGDIAGGAYACARCHTQGWSIDTENPDDPREPIGGEWPEWTDSEPANGAFGPKLRDEVPTQFATVDQLAEFIDGGSTKGEGQGRRGIGSGRMPAFGSNPNTEAEHNGMMTQEMVCSVALYVAGMSEGDDAPDGGPVAGGQGDVAEDASDDDAIAEDETDEPDENPQETFEDGGYCFGVLHDQELPEAPAEEEEDAE